MVCVKLGRVSLHADRGAQFLPDSSPPPLARTARLVNAGMTEERRVFVTEAGAADTVATSRCIAIGADVDPVMVLGTSDQVLRVLERGFPHVGIHVIGREITLVGTDADT